MRVGFSAHKDTFVLDRLPPQESWPELVFELPELAYPPRLNCAGPLLDDWVAKGEGDRVALRSPASTWTYQDLWRAANQIAWVLVEDLGLIPGNRVLLRGFNHPLLVAAWFGVVKAGGIVVATMPLLRAKELTEIVNKAQISHALCDHRLAAELEAALPACPSLRHVLYFGGNDQEGLETLMTAKREAFPTLETASDDPVLIAFTSGTTGKPKGCVHFHRDVLAICDTFSRHILRPVETDVFIGSPPIAFTYGLGGLVVFPFRVGASSVLLERATPDILLEAIGNFDATVCFTSPTAYRAMASQAKGRPGRLRRCVSAGEALPVATRRAWREATGLEIIDGIGSTEMLHIFVSHTEETLKEGSLGRPVPGYRATLLNEEGNEVAPGELGLLAVKGPTGCRYLDDPERQKEYVRWGWNLTGDACVKDEEGYFYYQGRVDDIIVTAGYNVSPLEVEEAVLDHPAVAECAVVGEPHPERGQVVKAYVVLRPGWEPGEALVAEIQEFVKQRIAPYKYPRVVEFCSELPRTLTGKVQRFRLRQKPSEPASP